MSLYTLNGLNIFDGSITFPRIGVWHADLSISTGLAPIGKAVLVLGSQTWNGSFSLQSGIDLYGRQRVRVVGGNGKIGTTVLAKGYNSVVAQIPIQDAIQDSGEVVSPSSDTGLLGTSLASWVRLQSPGSAALVAILQVIPNNPSWRVLPDGTIWVGFESWPIVYLKKTGFIHSDPADTHLLIGSFDPNILPGQTAIIVAGKRTQVLKISTVTHLLANWQIRSILRYENY